MTGTESDFDTKSQGSSETDVPFSTPSMSPCLPANIAQILKESDGSESIPCRTLNSGENKSLPAGSCMEAVRLEVGYEREAFRILGKIRIPSAEADSFERHPPPRCDPETCKAIRQKLCAWLDDVQRQWCLIWLAGPAGSGKSAVAQMFAEECISRGQLGGAFFFSRKQKRSDVEGFVATIVHQLAIQVPEYKKIVGEVLSRNSTILHKSLKTQFQILVVESFSRVRVQHPYVVIIDGLDECTSEQAQVELIELIGGHARYMSSTSTPAILWLISGRSEWHLKHAFKIADPPIPYKLEQLSGNAEDIYHILSNGLRKINNYFRFGGTSWPTQSQLRELVSKVGGLPIVAATILRFIANGAASPRLQLQACLESLAATGGTSDLSIDPLHELDNFYQQIMRAVPEPVLSSAKLIISFCIIYPSLPLDGRATCHLNAANFLGIDEDTFDLALQKLHSVVNMDPLESTSQQPPGFFSPSFPNFLQDQRRSGYFALDMVQARKLIDARFQHWTNDAKGKDWLLNSGFPEVFLDQYRDGYAQCCELTEKVMTSVERADLITGLKDTDAQSVVDFLSKLLDDHNITLSLLNKKLILRVLAKITKDAQVFPKAFELKGVHCSPGQPFAEGGVANIYHGAYKNQPVCLKSIRISAQKVDYKPRLRAQAGELVIWAHLSHQNILPFLGIYFSGEEIPDKMSLISPWMENGDLVQYLGRFPDSPRIPLLHDTISGLHYLHEFDIVHGDLKGKNVYISNQKRGMIADFGTTRVAVNLASSATNAGAGTLNWKAPEMLVTKDGKTSSKESDIWAFGCVCYEAVTGLEPFGELQPWELFAAFLRRDAALKKPSEPPSPEELNTVWPLAERCWEYDRSLRPTTETLLHELAKLNAQDNRPPELKTPKNREADLIIDYDRVYQILRQASQ